MLTLKTLADGTRLIGLITSNAYRDRDGEIVTEKALSDWVDSQWRDGEYVGDNVMLFWHDGEPIGDIIWSDMNGAFLVEIAKERQTPFAKEVLDMVERTPIEWGVSQGFAHAHRDKRGGEYSRIQKFESSILPRSMAANSFTYAETQKMTERRDTFLKKHAPQALELAKRLSGTAKASQSKLDTAGVERKSLETMMKRVVREVLTEVETKALDPQMLADDLEGMIQDLIASGEPAPDDLRERLLGLIGDTTEDDPDVLPADEEALADDAETLVTELIDSEEALPDDLNEQLVTLVEDTVGKGLKRRRTTAKQATAKAREEATIRSKQTELLEQLIGELEALDDVSTRLKALDALSTLPEVIRKMDRRMAQMERRLSGGPRAASKSRTTAVDDDDDLAQAIKSQPASDRLMSIMPDLFKK